MWLTGTRPRDKGGLRGGAAVRGAGAKERDGQHGTVRGGCQRRDEDEATSKWDNMRLGLHAGREALMYRPIPPIRTYMYFFLYKPIFDNNENNIYAQTLYICITFVYGVSED